MHKPLEIFLFNGCKSELCVHAHSVLLEKAGSLGKSVARHVVKLSGKEINVVISDGRVMRGLNRRFRKVDSATDVLSFPLGNSLYGEVWVCPGVVKKNAVEFNQKFGGELVRIVVHGILHLAGYDHKEPYRGSGEDSGPERENSEDEEMYRVQEKIVSEVLSK